MKITSYNIMSGGFNSYNYEEKFPSRINLLVKSVKKLDADFVSLIDTFRWDKIYTSSEIASLFGYPNVYCINLEDERLKKLGHNNGLTVMTREKVLSFEIVRLFNRNGIKTTLKFKNNKLDLLTVYLDDLSEETRLRQLEDLIKITNLSRPTVIMGDLNTFSPKDKKEIGIRLNQFYKLNPNLKEKYSPILKEMQKGSVLALLEKKGFMDTNYKKLPTAPSPYLGIKSLGSFLRIDYILTNRYLEFNQFNVHKGIYFDKVSDHYPISIQLL